MEIPKQMMANIGHHKNLMLFLVRFFLSSTNSIKSGVKY